MFKDNPLAEKTLGLTEEQNAQLMVLKYEEGVMAPYKLKANRELMMLQKVLLRDAVKTSAMKDLQAVCPWVGVGVRVSLPSRFRCRLSRSRLGGFGAPLCL